MLLVHCVQSTRQLHICGCYVAFPQVTIHPTDTTAAAPYSALFSCSVHAYGYLTVTWFKNNRNPVPEKAHSKLIPLKNATTSILTIPNVTIEDVGTYYCVVRANRRTAQSLSGSLILAGSIVSYIASYFFIYLAYMVHNIIIQGHHHHQQ